MMTSRLMILSCGLLLAGLATAQHNAFGFTYDQPAFWRSAPVSLAARVHFVRRRLDRAVQQGWLDQESAQRYYHQLSKAARDAETFDAAAIPSYARPGAPKVASGEPGPTNKPTGLRYQLNTIAAQLATQVQRNAW